MIQTESFLTFILHGAARNCQTKIRTFGRFGQNNQSEMERTVLKITYGRDYLRNILVNTEYYFSNGSCVFW